MTEYRGMMEIPGDEGCSVDHPYDEEQDFDPYEENGPYPGEECGRWNNGKLMKYCTKAGSEECDFECPYSR